VQENNQGDGGAFLLPGNDQPPLLHQPQVDKGRLKETVSRGGYYTVLFLFLIWILLKGR
jgi:hypothetical protein